MPFYEETVFTRLPLQAPVILVSLFEPNNLSFIIHRSNRIGLKRSSLYCVLVMENL